MVSTIWKDVPEVDVYTRPSSFFLGDAVVPRLLRATYIKKHEINEKAITVLITISFLVLTTGTH
jgi:hypothetical protein